MKILLMFKDRDFDVKGALPPNAADLHKDLELGTLFGAMTAGDPFLLEVAKQSILVSLEEPEVILYRRHILADCLAQPQAVREFYAIAVEALEAQKKVWSWSSGKYPEPTLRWAIEMLQLLVSLLKKLRLTADLHSAGFRSEGFTRFFSMLAKELDDDYLRSVENHLTRLTFRGGLRISAALGQGHKGTDFVLLNPPPYAGRTWIRWLRLWIIRYFGGDRPDEYTYEIPERDESGFRALEELRARGISPVAAALAQSTDHVLSFFAQLRLELGFYVGCLNLRDRLARKGEPICLPVPLAVGQTTLSAQGLYDPCLSLTLEERVVGNDVNANAKRLVMITGANRGGKSTFLRSVGLAQLMMQCGMFVPAESFRANVCDGLFTHFKRGEDADMKSGKLDEELGRMSTIVDHMTPKSLILLNESFAATNEREGSEIARQIVRALLESGIKVFFVTHLLDLAQGFYRAKMDTALFLRAERLDDGRRTFRLVEGEPLPTSFGEDLYRRILGAAIRPPTASSAAKVGESVRQEGQT